jgi:hypothetical protein
MKSRKITVLKRTTWKLPHKEPEQLKQNKKDDTSKALFQIQIRIEFKLNRVWGSEAGFRIRIQED